MCAAGQITDHTVQTSPMPALESRSMDDLVAQVVAAAEDKVCECFARLPERSFLQADELLTTLFRQSRLRYQAMVFGQETKHYASFAPILD